MISISLQELLFLDTTPELGEWRAAY
jgi:hypothetical protein